MINQEIDALPKLTAVLEKLDGQLTREIDVQFGRFLKNLDLSCDGLALAGFLLSQTLGKGNVCLDFSQPHDCLNANQLELLCQNISSSLVVTLIGDEEFFESDVQTPLALHSKRLYLQRYWLYEMALHSSIANKMQAMPWSTKEQWPLVKQLFSLNEKSDKQQTVDWQAVAACISANKQFSVISGGPGTGKTTTVIRLLALLISLYQNHFKRLPIIKLAAPTGKAAMRLTESINGAKQKLNLNDGIKDHIPSEASTLHRLLSRNRKGEFKYNEFNPLHLDVLIVDEASMVDLPLMSKLMAALPKHGQIILLGDKDQLASVEAGSVLADICDNEARHGYSLNNTQIINEISQQALSGKDIEAQGAMLRDHICQLRTSYRFDENSGIGFLARAANEGNFSQWQHTAKSGFDDLNLISLNDDAFKIFIKDCAEQYKQYLVKIDAQGSSDQQALEIYELFNRFQVLCALREGPLGVVGLNEAIETQLNHIGLIDNHAPWYMGRPVMVMENDYGMNLYNGDIGIILPLKDDLGVVRPKAAFINSEGGVRWLQPSRLPAHGTVYAMTVHKSQGSEFNHCALVLPDYHASVVSKELIYTGITRAKQKLTLLARDSVIRSGLKSRVQRSSGLRDRLWVTPREEPSKPTNLPIDSEPTQLSFF